MKKNPPSRRAFMKNMGVISLGFLGLKTFASAPFLKEILEPLNLPGKSGPGYGPLMQDAFGMINLPAGFQYKVISRMNRLMDDGLLVPGKPDGMATFPLDADRCIIIRNHELLPTDLEGSPFGPANWRANTIGWSKLYDQGHGETPGFGGTTTMVFNLKTQQVEVEYMSLAGTCRNCAGGPTPWGSWISCEESVERGGAGTPFEVDHGYNFEVPATEKLGLVEPIPLKAMGRFNHEAIAVDPRTGIVYQTEDRWDGLFYRFIPKNPGKLAGGGKLQALKVRGAAGLDTRNWAELNKARFPIGQRFEVEWIDMENIHSPYDEMRYEGFYKGATRFARGEGIWFGDRELFFACTNGGQIMKGQIFRYIPSPVEGLAAEVSQPGHLELFSEPNNTELLKSCDNLTISPQGDLVICEDDPKPNIVGITPQGEYFRIAQNVGFESEFAGGCFSPDGSTFFVNIQDVGLTLAITGPWKGLK